MTLCSRSIIFSVTIMALLLGGSSCNDPSFVGEDLIQDDIIDFDTKEDFEFVTTIAKGDSVLVFDRIATMENHRVGNIHDPFFGMTKASLALQLVSEAPTVDTSQVIEVDSVVLALAYNANNFYGDTTLPMNLEVFKITEYISQFAPYFSNEQYPISANSVGRLDFFTPKPTKPLTRITDNEEESDTTFLVPQLRVKLDNEVGMELLELDSISVQTDSLFLNNFGGIYIATDQMPGSLMGFRILSQATALTVHYRANNDERTRRYVVGEALTVIGQQYQHEYEGSPISNHLNTPQDSLIAVQGLAGLGTKIQIEGLEELENTLINRAELRIVLNERTDLDEDGIFPEIPALRLTTIENGSLQAITDLLLESTSSGFNFNGRLTEEVIDGDTVGVYSMNITTHLQEVIKTGENPTLFLEARNRADFAGNTLMYGPYHPKYPMRLKVIFTRE